MIIGPPPKFHGPRDILTYRDGGKVRNETVANLSALPCRCPKLGSRR
jgi:hypothetical protein